MGRDKNQFVDVLATIASMKRINIGSRIQPINIEVRNFQAHCCSLEEIIDEKPQYSDIKKFIQHQEDPPRVSKMDAKTLRKMAMDYYLDGEILYKRLFDGTFLRCLNEKEAK